MDIDEVIEKAQEIADKDSSCWMYCDCAGTNCDTCREQNTQLAEWLTKLKEYQQLEEQGRLIKLVPIASKETNADRIRNMSDEELAKLITGGLDFDCADYCDSFANGCAFNCGRKDREMALKWLQSEAE